MMKKKLFSMLMVCVLAACLCVPVFAAGNPQVRAGYTYKIYPNGIESYLLNVYGKGNENDNVTLYSPTNGNDQRWKVVTASTIGDTKYFYVVSELSSNQSLNIYHATKNCQLHSWVGNTTNGKSDSAVYFSTNNRIIMLRDWPDYNLSFEKVERDANVYWSPSRLAWGWLELRK